MLGRCWGDVGAILVIARNGGNVSGDDNAGGDGNAGGGDDVGRGEAFASIEQSTLSIKANASPLVS
jgi:hypothetical protein